MQSLTIANGSRIDIIPDNTGDSFVGSGHAATYYDATDLLTQALAIGSESTRMAYAGDWRHFAAWYGMEPSLAYAKLIADGPAASNGACLAYRQAMIDSGSAPKTINRRLSGIRKAFDSANMLGIIAWNLNIKGVKAATMRDCKGPSVDAVQMMIEHASVRDSAIMLLMYHMGFRRFEVASLNLEDYREGRIWIRGKGRGEKEPYTAPESVCRALDNWILDRGNEPGPMFNVDLSTINRIVKKAGAKIGINTHPHGLRHTAITEALRLTNGNIAEVQKFARHARPETTQIYNDSRIDAFGKIAGMIGSSK